jgi:hypothetical protein
MIAALDRLLASGGEWSRWAAASKRLCDAFDVTEYIENTARVYDQQACASLDGCAR